MVTIWLLYGYYMVTIWLLYGYYMVTIWLLYGYYMVTIWLLYSENIHYTSDLSINKGHTIEDIPVRILSTFPRTSRPPKRFRVTT